LQRRQIRSPAQALSNRLLQLRQVRWSANRLSGGSTFVRDCDSGGDGNSGGDKD